MSKKKNEIEHLDENEIASWAERKLSGLAPYASQIALLCALAFAAFVALAYFYAWRQQGEEIQWRELNTSSTRAAISGNPDALVEVHDLYPEQKSGMWALQMAGDLESRTGLEKMATDRETGLKQVNRAIEHFKTIVDAPDSAKTDELEQRALFALAYACEGSGDFDQAKKYYGQLLEEHPESFFREAAARGASRSTNDTLIAMFEKYKSYTTGDAPGELRPEAPDLSAPDFNLDDLNMESAPDDIEQPASGGGEFGDGDDSVGDDSVGDDTSDDVAPGETVVGESGAGSSIDNVDPAPEMPGEEPANGDGG